MKFIKSILILIVLCGCTSVRVKPKKIYLDDLTKNNQVYRVKDNSYFYFMIDSLGNKHLVKMNTFNCDKVLWIERLNRVNNN